MPFEKTGFGMFKVGRYVKEKLIKCFTELLVAGYSFTSSMKLIFPTFDEFWVNNGRTVLQKLLLSVFF